MRALLLAAAIAIVLAGCAADNGTTDDGETTSDTTAPSGPTTGAPSGSGAGTTTDGATTAASPWAAFDFQDEVDPRDGRSGKIQSYSYTTTQTHGAGTTVLDVDVEVLGTSTENVRSTRFDLTGASPSTSAVTTPLEVVKLRHTIRVERDDSGEHQAGDTSSATMWIPTDESVGQGTFLWRFVHLDRDEDGVTGVWEYVGDATGTTAPYTEGEDPTSWWGFEHLLATYGLSWWAGLFAEDAEIQEGTYGFGGFQYTASRETLRVSGYGFDGWRIQWSGAAEGESASFAVAVAPELPIPFEHDYGSSGGSGTSRIAYKLTALELG